MEIRRKEKKAGRVKRAGKKERRKNRLNRKTRNVYKQVDVKLEIHKNLKSYVFALYHGIQNIHFHMKTRYFC